jgi:glucose dehydrogenase
MRRTLLPLSVFVIAAFALWTIAGRAADKDRDWPAYAGDKASTKYSPIDQISSTSRRS